MASKPPRRARSHPRGSHAVLIGLERDGLVRITQPLKGRGRTGTPRSSRSPRRARRDRMLPTSALDGSRQAAERAAQARRPAARGARTVKSRAEGIDARRSTTGASAHDDQAARRARLVTMSRRRVERDPAGHGALPSTTAREPHVLTDEQAAAFERLDALAAAVHSPPSLLHGVTGSGKTEIVSAARGRRRAAAGARVLLLVPEIALTPAVAGDLPARRSASGSRSSTAACPTASATISGSASGAATSTSSSARGRAVFAPLRSLGLIIVDEEHDGSYKQEESPRYHGRDVAVVRGSHAGALVVLGSATPVARELPQRASAAATRS